ncbi:acyltransferase family protein [Cronobacter malonaticus]
MEFRRDINGLRAIAVIAVVFYHFGVPGFSGGFAGVDIFFVISGYLMTSIIFRKIHREEFSFYGFYLDRATRIVPALTFLCAVVAFTCWFFLIPSDYEALGKHIIASIAFLSNVIYFNEVNYFDVSASQKWLLHTWSLSVEWQFYIIYPIIAFALYKFKKNYAKKFLFVLMVTSFIFSAFLVFDNKISAAFYLLPSRAWEMLLGGMIFLYGNNKPNQNLKGVYYLALAGILASVFSFDKLTAWPSIPTLLPTISAALIIYCQCESSILNNQISQYLGKISYSIYLWHWPLTVLLSYFEMKGAVVTAAGIISSVVLGSISYHLIERPSLNLLRKKTTTRKLEISSVFTLFLIPTVVGAIILNTGGFPSRYPFSLLTTAEIMKERARYWVEGDKENPVPITGSKKIVIIGNSHGIDLTYALTENGLKGDITYLRTTAYCSNFGLTPNLPEYAERCANSYSHVINHISLKNAEIIFLHDDWHVENKNDLLTSVNTIRSKTSAQIIVVGPKMTFTKSASDIAALAMKSKKSTVSMINDFAKNYYSSDRKVIDKDAQTILSSVEYKAKRVTYISALNIQCGRDLNCEIINKDSNKYIYFDGGHFSMEGSRKFGKKLKESTPDVFN